MEASVPAGHRPEWNRRGVFYTLMGVGSDGESIRSVAKRWLDKGRDCADPGSVSDLV